MMDDVAHKILGHLKAIDNITVNSITVNIRWEDNGSITSIFWEQGGTKIQNILRTPIKSPGVEISEDHCLILASSITLEEALSILEKGFKNGAAMSISIDLKIGLKNEE